MQKRRQRSPGKSHWLYCGLLGYHLPRFKTKNNRGEAKPKKNRHGSKPPRPCKGGGTLVRRSRARRLAPSPGCFRPTCRALGGLSLAALALKHDIVNCGLHTSWPSATPWLTLCLRNGRAEVQRCMSSCTTATVTVQPPAAIESAPSPGNVVRI